MLTVLKTCAFLRRDGLKFWSDGIDEFQVDPEGVQFLRLTIHDGDAYSDVLGICRAFILAIGAVTLLDEEWSWVEVKVRMSDEDILAGFN